MTATNREPRNTKPEEAIIKAIKRLGKQENVEEIAYLAISGGVENYIRDKIAYALYADSKGELLGLTEKKRIDLLVGRKVGEAFKRRVDCILELKCALPAEAIKDKELVRRIDNDFAKIEIDKLPSMYKREGADYIFPESGVIGLWLFVFPRVDCNKPHYKKSNKDRQFLHLIHDGYRSGYRYMAGDTTGCRNADSWKHFDKRLTACLKAIETHGPYEKLADGKICSGIGLLGTEVSLEYHLFRRKSRLALEGVEVGVRVPVAE